MNDIDAESGYHLHTSLAKIIDGLTTGEEDRATIIPNLSVFRREQPSPPRVCLVEQTIVVVVQGVKQMWLDGQGFQYDRDRFLLTSLDIPAFSEVLEASSEQPCLGFTYRLDVSIITELLAQGAVSFAQRPPRQKDKGMEVSNVSAGLLKPCLRLFELIDEPDAIEALAPLFQREIHYRLLVSDQGQRLRQLAANGSQSQRIANAIDWLKVNYRSPLTVDELASRVQISTSSLYQHFRQLTGMSPLQYQKWLRLNEAKRLMLNEHMDAASAAFDVGYESPSQFSREYRRLFGLPPKKDIDKLRQAGNTYKLVGS